MRVKDRVAAPAQVPVPVTFEPNRLTTHRLTGLLTEFGIGTGGPKRQPMRCDVHWPPQVGPVPKPVQQLAATPLRPFPTPPQKPAWHSLSTSQGWPGAGSTPGVPLQAVWSRSVSVAFEHWRRFVPPACAAVVEPNVSAPVPESHAVTVAIDVPMSGSVTGSGRDTPEPPM